VKVPASPRRTWPVSSATTNGRISFGCRIGVGGTGWTLQGEVFPTAVRGQAAAIAATVDWLANFALIEVFPVWQNAISLAGVMVCFAALCAAAIAFVYWFLPETKGLPVEEIVRVFERQRGTLQPVAAVQD
jgi:sugar transport protein